MPRRPKRRGSPTSSSGKLSSGSLFYAPSGLRLAARRRFDLRSGKSRVNFALCFASWDLSFRSDKIYWLFVYVSRLPFPFCEAPVCIGTIGRSVSASGPMKLQPRQSIFSRVSFLFRRFHPLNSVYKYSSQSKNIFNISEIFSREIG